MATTQEKPKAGDMIDIFRGRYWHWAIYVGNGYVVHVQAEDGESSKGLADSSRSVAGTPEGKQKLMDVVGDDQWQVNNYWDKKHKPRPVDVIVKEALAQVGRKVDYSLLNKNCEHFTTKLRYGEAHSWQGEMAVGMLALDKGKVVEEATEQLEAQDAICQKNSTSSRCICLSCTFSRNTKNYLPS